MSSVVDKNDVIFNKKDAIKKLNALLESYIMTLPVSILRRLTFFLFG